MICQHPSPTRFAQGGLSMSLSLLPSKVFLARLVSGDLQVGGISRRSVRVRGYRIFSGPEVSMWEVSPDSLERRFGTVSEALKARGLLPLRSRHQGGPHEDGSTPSRSVESPRFRNLDKRRFPIRLGRSA
jgi:hypothetical protein